MATEYSTEIKLKLVETTLKTITRQAIQAVKIPEKIAVQDLSEEHSAIRVDPDRIKREIVRK